MTEFALPTDLTGHEIALPFPANEGRVIDLNYDHTGRLLVLCYVTNSLALWEPQSGKVLAERGLHQPPAGGLLARNGDPAVVYFKSPVQTNNSVVILNWKGDIRSLSGAHQGIVCLALSEDGRRLASVDCSGLGRIWETDTGSLLLSVPTEVQKGIGIAFDQSGQTLAVAGEGTQIRRVEALENQGVVSVANASPKAGTTLGGIGLILVGVSVDALGAAAGTGGAGSAIGWDPNWFKSASTMGLAVAAKGDRIALLNHTPNLAGGFQVRMAEAQSGHVSMTRSLPSGFTVWGTFARRAPIYSWLFPGDRTLAQPVFSPDGLQVAIPGSGICLLDFSPAAKTAPKDLWLAQPSRPNSARAHSDWRQQPFLFEVHPVCTTNLGSALARSPHRRICVEMTKSDCGRVWGEVPIGLGMRHIWEPVIPIERTVWQALQQDWQASGQELVSLNEDFDVSSTLVQWHLEAGHSFKGWEFTAVMVIELQVRDAAGTLLHTGRYRGETHEARLWEPSSNYLGQLQNLVLGECLMQMRNDPKWAQVLSSGLSAK